MVNQQFEKEEHARVYSVYRPNPPAELIQIVLQYLKENVTGELSHAVDVGCGSGQSSVILAPHFRQVTGFDASNAQIKEAKAFRQEPNIRYVVKEAELLPLDDDSTELLTASSCLHWFDTEVFFREVRRVLVPNGVLAAYTYRTIQPVTENLEKAEKIDQLMKQTWEVDLMPYWSSEVQVSFQEYETITFPFQDVTRLRNIRQTFEGKLSDVLGFLTTLSAYQNLLREDNAKAVDLLSRFHTRLANILEVKGEPDSINLTLYRDFSLILCRNTK